MKSVFAFAFVLFSFFPVFGQNEKIEKSEYLVVRVQYGANLAGYKYEVFLDIGISGAHSMSGQVVNQEDVVTITDESGKHEFKSDMDLVNYLAQHGWVVLQTGIIDILDQHYTSYLMERTYVK